MNVLHYLAIALALVGLPLAWWGVRNYRRQGERHADAIARWVKGAGTVIESRIIERERTSSSNDASYTSYEPRLHYRYAVEGIDLEGTRVALCGSPSFNSQDRADEWLRAHPPGTAIDLWYDPANPADSAPTLDKPSLLSAIVTVFAGLFLVAMAGMVLSSGL
jgi:hypothetical protein